MKDIPRRERIALAVDEFYQSILDEIRYIAEWYAGGAASAHSGGWGRLRLFRTGDEKSRNNVDV
jgi:hypothetical protein